VCTIVAIKGLHPEYGLVLAANRDEFHARPARPPEVLHEAPRVVAGLDVPSGGTWLGANAHGVFVALTNQRQYEGADDRLASRGLVVRRALEAGPLDAVDAFVEGLDARLTNSFNLFWGDATTLRVGYARRDRAPVAVETLGDGVWVLPNDRIGSLEFPKTQRALALTEPFVTAPWPVLAEGLARMLGDHEEPPLSAVPAPPTGAVFDHATLRRLQALCVHLPVYGTRSATLLALRPGRVAHHLFADGPPCVTPFEDRTELHS